MELKDIFKEKEHTCNIQGRKIVIEDNKAMFPLYKKLGLDVFKEKVKNDKASKGSN